jgi:hypothetical protein
MKLVRCPKCNTQKDESCFSKNRSRSTGRNSYCKDCVKPINKFHYERHHGPVVYAPRLTKEEKAKRIAAKNKSWYLRNLDYHPNRRKDPIKRLAMCMRTRVYCAIKRHIAICSKSAPTVKLIGCSIEFLRKHLESRFRDGMTWENYGPYWHVDHIRPIASFDLTNPLEQEKCFHYSNLQPLLKHENLKKNKKYEDQSSVEETPVESQGSRLQSQVWILA